MKENEFDELSNFFSNYEKKKETTQKLNVLSHIFNPRDDSEQFRMLPPEEGKRFPDEAYFHRIEVNDAKYGKKYRTLYCPRHNNAPVENEDGTKTPHHCPLCERHEKLMAKIDNSVKYIKKENATPEQLKIKEKNKKINDLAKPFEARRFYILKGIDRNRQKDGVKFWRFIDNKMGQGILDKLVPVMKNFFHDYDETKPYDAEKGCDFGITVSNMNRANGGTYRGVSSIVAKKPSKLHDDPILVKQWLNSPLTWRDIFKPTPVTRVLSFEEYLEMVAHGDDPYFDDNDPSNKKYVFPNEEHKDLQEKANTSTANLDTGTKSQSFASDLSATPKSNSKSSVEEDDVDVDMGDEIDDILGEKEEKKEKKTTPKQEKVEEPEPAGDFDVSEIDDIDDLPF